MVVVYISTIANVFCVAEMPLTATLAVTVIPQNFIAFSFATATQYSD
jgi:hypothetical protein